MNGGQTTVARRSNPDSPGRLLHPVTLRATPVRRFAAHFRAWRTAADESREQRPCRRAPRTGVPEGRGFSVGFRGPDRSARTPVAFDPH